MMKQVIVTLAFLFGGGAQAAEDAARRNPEADKAIDAAFIAWSNSEWFADKYIPNTARETQEKTTPDGLLVRGTFKFSRLQGPPMELPFAALLNKPGGSFSVVDVCYNDAERNDLSCRSTGAQFARDLLGKAVRGELR